MPILSIRPAARYRHRNPVAMGECKMMFRPHERHDQRRLVNFTISRNDPSSNPLDDPLA
jgi:hypothetical protein